jgi:hypothetical protein
MSRTTGRASPLFALSCCILGLLSADIALAQSAIVSVPNSMPAFRPMLSSGQVPTEIVGAWQVQIEGQAFKLKANYNIEIKFNDGLGNMPAAIVSYFAGDASRPTTICRSQLKLVSTEGASYVFEESLNYKGGKDSCPIWGRIAVEPRDGSLWFQWRDAAKRKAKIRMEAGAYHPTGGKECRLVSGDGGVGGRKWCRDTEGNWNPA